MILRKGRVDRNERERERIKGNARKRGNQKGNYDHSKIIITKRGE